MQDFFWLFKSKPMSNSLTPEQVQYRQRQIEMAKRDPDYIFLMQFTDRYRHPPVPSATNARYSLRAFRGLVTWRRAFHDLATAERRRLGLPNDFRSVFHFPPLRKK